MQQQNDWYTGIDYFQSYKEQDIQVEEQSLAQPVPLTRHERVELWYVLKGDGDILVNGVLHTVQQDSFLCLYAHHLYEVSCVRKPLRVLRIQFYIGLFMHAMWEKHPRGRNASLVYETPACLRCADSEVLQLFHRAQQESYGNAFGSRNMLMYIVLQIHMLFCRYALQESMEEEQSPVWKLIKRTIVASQEHTTLQDAAAKLQLHPRYLNQKIKDACGYSFTQLRSFGKIINACALLHFEDLSISYIVDLLSYSSTAGFYRQFQAWTGMSPLDYQKHRILDNAHFYCRKDLYLQIMQYLYLHFSQDISKSVQSCLFQRYLKLNQIFFRVILIPRASMHDLTHRVRHFVFAVFLQPFSKGKIGPFYICKIAVDHCASHIWDWFSHTKTKWIFCRSHFLYRSA